MVLVLLVMVPMLVRVRVMLALGLQVHCAGDAIMLGQRRRRRRRRRGGRRRGGEGGRKRRSIRRPIQMINAWTQGRRAILEPIHIDLISVRIGPRVVRLDNEDGWPAGQLRRFLVMMSIAVTMVLVAIAGLPYVVRAVRVVVWRGARGPGEQKIRVHTGRRQPDLLVVLLLRVERVQSRIRARQVYGGGRGQDLCNTEAEPRTRTE